MKKIKFTVLFLVIIAIVVGYVLVSNYFKVKSFDKEREGIVSEIDNALNEASLAGNYECCIEPPCKMCYLGNWIWDDGRCDCDGEIAQGNWDNVCPECKKGVEEGRCSSSKTPGTCPVD